MTYSGIKDFLHELKQLAKAECIPWVGGRADLPAQPGLKVQGRPISLPVHQADLDWLCTRGQASPFGTGTDTILDTEIRRSVEFEAQDTELSNPDWDPALAQLIASISAQMGIDFQIRADLFKLLVYREGGHFRFHQDTEKAPGMFASLIVQLPARCRGGSLVCRFADKNHTFDFGNTDAASEFSLYYAAHYADVHHQVEEIEEGARLVLVYNLIQPLAERQLSAGHHTQLLDSARERVLAIFSMLSQEQHAFLLQHEYTEQSLSDLGFLATKGRDRDLLKALLAINEHLPLDQKLYFMISRVSYSVTSDGYGGDYDDNNIHWEEIDSSEPGCDLCFDEAGQAIPVGQYPIDWVHDLNEKDIRSLAFHKIDEDFWGDGDDDIEGYMGNYGPTKETTYARYLLAVMPVYPAGSGGPAQDTLVQAHRVSLMARDLRTHPECDWLQARFDRALNDVFTHFKASLSQAEPSCPWRRGFDQADRAVFTTLLKTAIEGDDQDLCKNLLIAAKDRLIASLSSDRETEKLTSLLKEAIDCFGWKTLAASAMPCLTALSGRVALRTSIALVKNNSDITMRTHLIDICVSAVCREKKSWGGDCRFKETILPLAVNLCKTDWHAPDKSKDLFLATCLEKAAEQPSFLCVLIETLDAETQADHKEWLLSPLIAARLQHLDEELRREPEEFTWAMPDASVGKSTIRAFLRSDSPETRMTGYDGIAMARNDLVDVKPEWIVPAFYMESNAEFLQPGETHGFSASMQASGRGKQACVEIKKDTRYHDLCLKLRTLRQQEFKKLNKRSKPDLISQAVVDHDT